MKNDFPKNIINRDPIVSIVMPTHNRLKYLKIAIDSVIRQSLGEWELLVIDDGSTDGTVEYMNMVSAEDDRIKYYVLQTDNVPGISKYLNYGLFNARGEYIARLDDDDSWCNPDKLKLQVEFLRENDEYILVGGGIIMVNEDLNELFKYYKKNEDFEIRKYALLSNPFSHTSVMFRKKTAVELGGYQNLPYAEDWDFWLRMGRTGKFFNIKSYFTYYMSAGQNKSFLHQRKQAKAILSIIENYKNDYPNYYKGFILNFLQLLFSYLPLFIRKRIQTFLYYIKRKHF